MHQRNVPLKAAADLSASQYLIVELTGNINEINLPSQDRGYGVLQNHPKLGEFGTVCVEGQSRVRAGSAVAIGDFITASSLGFALSVTSGAARALPGRTSVLGRALSAAASGSVFTADLDVFQTTVVSGGAW
jgi:hypothetical protein